MPSRVGPIPFDVGRPAGSRWILPTGTLADRHASASVLPRTPTPACSWRITWNSDGEDRPTTIEPGSFSMQPALVGTWWLATISLDSCSPPQESTPRGPSRSFGRLVHWATASRASISATCSSSDEGCVATVQLPYASTSTRVNRTSRGRAPGSCNSTMTAATVCLRTTARRELRMKDSARTTKIARPTCAAVVLPNTKRHESFFDKALDVSCARRIRPRSRVRRVPDAPEHARAVSGSRRSHHLDGLASVRLRRGMRGRTRCAFGAS